MRLAPLLALCVLVPLRAQAPAMASEADPGPSQLAFPVRVNLAPLLQEIERAAPRIPPGAGLWTPLPNGPQGSCYRFQLEREELRFTVRDKRLVVRTSAKYGLEVGLRMVGNWYKGVGGCGLGKEPQRTVQFTLHGEVDLTPDWTLRLQVSADDPRALDPCQITFLGYDITDKVVAGMKAELLKATQALEQQVRDEARLRQRAEALWRSAQAPQELAPGIFLLLNPERIRLAPIRSEGQTLVLTPEILARPSIVLGTRPDMVPRGLPPLETGSAVNPGFRVQLDLDLPFAEATRQLKAQVAGKTFETEKGRFEILDATVEGKGGKALLDIHVKGRVDGHLSLVGRPVYDPVKGTVRLEDLDYTLASKSWISSFGEWLFRSSLRRTLQEKANWFLEKSLADLRGQIQQGLNREVLPGIRLKGELAGLRLGPPRILEDRFRIEATLEGSAEVAVTSVSGFR